MSIKNLKIRTKLFGGFLAVVIIFALAGLYQIGSVGSLRTLQNEGAVRAQDAVAILEIDSRLGASYGIIADAIINRNIEVTKKKFEHFKEAAQKDIETVQKFANTEVERQLAVTFTEHYRKYVDIFEKELLPVLMQGEDALKRAADALAIGAIQQKVMGVYQIATDAIVNRDLEGAKNEFARVKAEAGELMIKAQNIVDNEDERMRMETFSREYGKYLEIIEQRLFPALEGGTVSDETVREVDDELDIARGKVMAQVDLIVASINDKMQKASAQEKKIRELNAALDANFAACMAPLDKMGELLVAENMEGDRIFDSISKSTINTIIIVCLIGMVVSMLIGFFISRAITGPVNKAVALANVVAVGDVTSTVDLDQQDEIGVLAAAMNRMVVNLKTMAGVAEKIADGDLTVAVQPLSEKDALGNALKSMIDKLSNVVTEINVSAGNVAAGAEQMSSTSQAMSQGATEQASSLEEITSSMHEIASQTKQNAENANQASKLAGEAKQCAAKGNEQMGQMVASMNEISESSRNISKIIKVIDEIAFQTNLLALNAAVEAARAGKHGKGFAVVAEEVRNLAARSAKAARETAEMIEGAVKKIEGGTDIANRTAGALQEIVTAAARVTDLVAEIAAASNEQAQGVSQITTGLGQVDQVTQQNTAHAEESASASEELSSQAMLLQRLISTFKVDETAGSRGSAGSGHAGSEPQAIAGEGVNMNRKAGEKKMLNTANNAAEPWGGIPVAESPEPEINLDDRGFGKY